MKHRSLIIAGTEKSGTTSVYQYLNAHPNVVGSVRKETDFFRSMPPHSLAAYEALYPPSDSDRILMEASPGYLADSHVAAASIYGLLPDANLLFILRDPIDRLLSSFEFHKSRFFISQEVSFDEYIGLCKRFERSEIGIDEAGMGEWFLRVPDAGRYAHHLRDYEGRFADKQIKVLTLDRLQRDAHGFMSEICDWAGLDSRFYDDFEFVHSNVTFSPRRAWLQRLGLWINETLEPFFNRHSAIKSNLLTIYKRVNGQKVQQSDMSLETRKLLLDYYRKDVQELVARYGDDVVEATNWLNKHEVDNA